MTQHLDVAVPDGVCGDWRVETFTVSEEDAKMTRMRAMFSGSRDAEVPAGTYKRLMHGHDVVMSNTPMEVRTNATFIRKATGDVLINGLGLGMVLTAILKKPEVTSVTVVEIAEEVIELVGPTFRHDPRVTIVHADATTYQPKKGQTFDAVWHDIWTFITADNLDEMKTLHRKYGRRTQWQASWCRAQCELQRDRNSYVGWR